MIICDSLRKSVLQAAIQGKLTKQLESDSHASELLASIQEERRRLVKEKKIRKEDQIHPVSENEIPFDIPDNWVWARLGAISTYGNSQGKVKSDQIPAETWALDLEDIEKGTSRILVRRTVANRKIDGEKSIFFKGNILYGKLRPYLLKVLIAPEDGICTPELVPFDVLKCDAAFFVSVLKSPYVDASVNAVTYGMKMPRVGTDTMLSLPLPLPPLAEQHRIVARIDELMAKIGELQVIEDELRTMI